MVIKFYSLLLVALLFSIFLGCSSPNHEPDKTLGGAVLGAAWGAGAGAVVGNQFSHSGEGIAIGAGFGILSGAAAGAGYDAIEDIQATQEDRLEAIRTQNEISRAGLADIQARLDTPGRGSASTPTIHQIYFDSDVTSIKAGAVTTLETVAEAIKRDPHIQRVEIRGHTDDTGNPDYNVKLSEARAKSVSSFLAFRGVAMDVLRISSRGATEPAASNSVPEGRQLNRRVEVVIRKVG